MVRLRIVTAGSTPAGFLASDNKTKDQPMDSLDEWRKRIDDLDLQLVRLLNERAHCAEEIGRIKLGLGLGAYSPEREEEVMRNITTNNPGPLSRQAIRRLFERIIDESRTVERVFMSEQQKSGGSERK